MRHGFKKNSNRRVFITIFDARGLLKVIPCIWPALTCVLHLMWSILISSLNGQESSVFQNNNNNNNKNNNVLFYLKQTNSFIIRNMGEHGVVLTINNEAPLCLVIFY